MLTKSYSQAGQDRFVHALLPYTSGTFLDVGSCHPIEKSNTYALEQLGWTGVLVDSDPGVVELTPKHRTSRFVSGDATDAELLRNLPLRYGVGDVIDYFSLDVDNATSLVVGRFPWLRWRFRVMTIEHDSYRFGNGPRDTMRRVLQALGYYLLCADVCDQGLAFEDWWVHPTHIQVSDEVMPVGADWREVVAAVEACAERRR